MQQGKSGVTHTDQMLTSAWKGACAQGLCSGGCGARTPNSSRLEHSTTDAYLQDKKWLVHLHAGSRDLPTRLIYHSSALKAATHMCCLFRSKLNVMVKLARKFIDRLFHLLPSRFARAPCCVARQAVNLSGTYRTSMWAICEYQHLCLEGARAAAQERLVRTAPCTT